MAVDIRLWLVDFLNDRAFAVIFLGGLCRWKCIRLVRTLGTPRHVVPVAERVHHENVDKSRHDQQVRRERREHVPRVAVHERRDEVETKGGSKRDDNDTGACASEEGREKLANSLVSRKIESVSRERTDDQVHGLDEDVELNDGEENEGCEVRVFGSANRLAQSDEKRKKRTNIPLWTITQSQDELQKQETEVHVLDDGVDNRSRRIAEWPPCLTAVFWGVANKIDDDGGSEPVRSYVSLAWV